MAGDWKAEIIKEPVGLGSDHECGYALYKLGNRPVGTVATCCGHLWQVVWARWYVWLTLRALEPVRHHSGKVWIHRGKALSKERSDHEARGDRRLRTKDHPRC